MIMIKRQIKFPLNMKNGAKVRSLEELRENADLESVMGCYFSGALSRWCAAFGYGELPPRFDALKAEHVRQVCDTLGLSFPDDEIKAYAASKFAAAAPAAESEAEETPADAEEAPDAGESGNIREKLRDIVDKSVDLNDYEFGAVPVKNSVGKTEKYRVTVTCGKTEQYARFTIPCQLTADYTRENFRRDLYRKIVNCVRHLGEEAKYNGSVFSTLKAGETVTLGRWEEKPLEWTVLKKETDRLYVLCTGSVGKRRFDPSSNNWVSSELRGWLNGAFYDRAFTSAEKCSIREVNGDRITLLSSEEAKSLTTEKQRAMGDWWWLRSPGSLINDAADVYDDVSVDEYGNYVYLVDLAVRPALWIDLES